MGRFEIFVEALDSALDTRRKRHIVGGVMLSISLLFGGLAFTAMSYKTEDDLDV